jgi:hypothetical protein
MTFYFLFSIEKLCLTLLKLHFDREHPWNTRSPQLLNGKCAVKAAEAGGQSGSLAL